MGDQTLGSRASTRSLYAVTDTIFGRVINDQKYVPEGNGAGAK